MPDAYVRPDPLIYAQYYLMARGGGHVGQPRHRALRQRRASVLGQLAAQSRLRGPRPYLEWLVRRSGLGVGVTLSFLSFGIATTSTPVGTTLVNLGAKGAPSVQPLRRSHGAHHLRRATTVQASLEWHDDANADNNLGQENVTSGSLHRRPRSRSAYEHGIGSAAVCSRGRRTRFRRSALATMITGGNLGKPNSSFTAGGESSPLGMGAARTAVWRVRPTRRLVCFLHARRARAGRGRDA